MIEVLDQYKASRTAAAPAAAPAPAVPVDPDAALAAKRERQKQALGTTQTRSAPMAPAGGPAKDDFDAGFERGAATT